MTRPTECSECGQIGATYKTRDAAGYRHNFHPPCFAALAWFLDGNDGEPPPAYVARVVRRIEVFLAKCRARRKRFMEAGSRSQLAALGPGT